MPDIWPTADAYRDLQKIRAALAANPPTDAMRDKILGLLDLCERRHGPDGGQHQQADDLDRHEAYVVDAKDAAEGGEWTTCQSELGHGNGGVNVEALDRTIQNTSETLTRMQSKLRRLREEHDGGKH